MQESAKRQKTTTTTEPEVPPVPIDPALENGGASVETSGTSAQSAPPTPQAGDAPAPGVDKDGFAVPYRKPTQEDLTIANAATAEVDGQLEDLADEFGDSDDEEPEEVDPSSEMAMAAAQGIQIPGMENMKIKPREPVPGPEHGNNPPPSGDEANNQKPEKPVLRIDDEWELDENNLEQEMQGHLNDPVMIGASALVTRDIEQRREKETTAHANLPPAPALPEANAGEAPGQSSTETAAQPLTNGAAPSLTPQSNVSDDPIVHEDEFKDDPEVMFCKLSERDVLLKEMIWANHNKDYMRKVQQKIFEAKVLQNNPPKQKRSRARKPRIGEGQASPAGSATEAAQNMLRTRAISTKLDYSRMGNLFEFSKTGPGSTYGGTSSVGSRSAIPSDAGSDAGSDVGSDDANGVQTPTPAATAETPQERVARALAPPEEEEEEEQEDDNEFGGEEGFGEDTYEEEDFDPFGDNNGGEDFEE